MKLMIRNKFAQNKKEHYFIINSKAMFFKQVSVKDLRGKVVGLYITDLDIVTEDYLILQQILHVKLDDQERREHQYEIVWVPVVDYWTKEKYRKFESLRDQMEWLAVDRPSEIASQVIRYFRERCNFVKKPLLVVMDIEGKVVHKDAIQMFCIWGNEGYPFSFGKEISLWQEMGWKISNLAQGINKYLSTWVSFTLISAVFCIFTYRAMKMHLKSLVFRSMKENIFAYMEEKTWNGSGNSQGLQKLSR